MRISKRALQEEKARQIFRKADSSYPLLCTRVCAYQGVTNVCFSRALFPCNKRFEIRPFVLLMTTYD